MSPNDLVFIAALVLLAVCAALVGFNFFAALGFSLALGLVFHLVQSGLKGGDGRNKNGEE
ncbi:MAG TPA: hypothetical protein VF398_09055 [bacterium]|jgi:hypothetical protein